MNRTTKLALLGFVLATGCDEPEGVEIGPRGGIVESEDGRFVLDIPAGALESAIEITVDEVECERPGSIGACYELGPVGLPLLRPGTITYELDRDELGGIDVAALDLLTAREDEWSPLADREVDVKGEIVSGSAVYLSAYAVVAVD